MAGVAAPMFRVSVAKAVRFLVGFTVGVISSALVVGLCIFLAGKAIHALFPSVLRTTLVVVICATLGAADLLNRTPHVWRQVPQALVRQLSPGFLGVVWGLDLGLLFTTQKVASLMWGAIAAVSLLQPQQAPLLLVIIGLLTALTVVVKSLWPRNECLNHGTKQDRRWLRLLRTASGSLLLAACAFTVVGSFLG
jgi:hypothetical protein